jgi:hypothetical protein
MRRFGAWTCALRATFLLVAMILLAGCAGGQKAAPAQATSQTIALGSIEGRVLDDEQVPVAGVGVQLVEAGMNATSGPDGRFRFEAVVVGTHTMQVRAPGFEPHREKVEVAMDQTATATLVLKPVASVVPFIEMLPYEGYIQHGNLYVDMVTTTLGANGCQKCRFYFNASGDVDALVSEIQFQRTVDNPHGPEVLAYALWTQDMKIRYTPDGQYWPSGGRFEIERRWGAEGVKLVHTHACDDLWVCVDQTFTNYVSLFHSQGVPAGYTALPKD